MLLQRGISGNLVRLGISLYLIWSRRARCTIKMLKNNITWFVFVIYSIVSSLFLSGRLHPFVPTKQNFSTPNIRKCLQSGRLNARLCFSDILCLYSPSLVALWNILKSLYLSGIIVRQKYIHWRKLRQASACEQGFTLLMEDCCGRILAACKSVWLLIWKYLCVLNWTESL